MGLCNKCLYEVLTIDRYICRAGEYERKPAVERRSMAAVITQRFNGLLCMGEGGEDT